MNQQNRPAEPSVPRLKEEVTILRKFLSDSWRPLDLPLINCKGEL